MLFASLTAEGWVIVIGAVFIGLNGLFNSYLTWRSNAKIDDNTKVTKNAAVASVIEVKKVAENVAAVAVETANAVASEAKVNSEAVLAIAKQSNDTVQHLAKAVNGDLERQNKSIVDRVDANTERIERLNIHAKANAEHLRVMQVCLSKIMASKGLTETD